MPIHISNKKVNDIHVGTKKVLTTWIGTDRVYLASTLSMLIKGYTEKSGDSLLSANTPFKFTGENLFKQNFINGSFDSVNGALTTGSNQRIRTENKTVLKSGTYTISFAQSFQIVIYIYDMQDNYIRSESTVSWTDNKTFSITGYRKVMIGLRKEGNLEISPSELTNFMVNKGTTAKPYEPYHETFYNPTEGFSLNGINNIYDTFNTINGELTKRFGIVDLGEQDWVAQSSRNNYEMRCEAIRTLAKKPSSIDTKANIFCVRYSTLTGTQIWLENTGISLDTGGSILVYDPNFNSNSSISAFKQAMSGVYLVYELATPQTYQKKTKTLPQWVKHVFDSSGRELEATITQ